MSYSEVLTVKQMQRQLALGQTIRFDRFMETCLYAKDGYYTQHVNIGGEGADFYTSASSPLFAHAMARFVIRCWRAAGEPGVYQVAELGAGEGTLAAHLLSALDALLPPAVNLHYCIVEVSPRLQQRQSTRLQQQLKTLPNKRTVSFQHETPNPELPTCMIGNEVLDALPVRRFKFARGHIKESYAVLKQGRVVEEFNSFVEDRATVQFLQQWLPLRENTIGEICFSYDAFFRPFSDYGAPLIALWLDYGITLGELRERIRPLGTLRAYKAHRLVSPFDHLGDADITADVHWDFARFSILKAGFKTAEIFNQGQFLMDYGILNAMQEIVCKEDKYGLQYARLARELKNLVLPGGQGERFRAIVCER